MSKRAIDLEILELEDEATVLTSGDMSSSHEAYYLTDHTMPIAPPGVAFCDCNGANDAQGLFFKDPNRAGSMQRVTATADDTCPHCHHQVFYRRVERPNKNHRASHNFNKKKREPKPALMDMPDKAQPRGLKIAEVMPISYESSVILPGVRKY